jgi:hypothetical protein
MLTQFATEEHTYSTRREQYTGLLLVLLLGAFLGSVQAQVLYGSLTGNVTDASGAAVANAVVEALNVDTGLAQKATTDSSGIYHFSAIQSGSYKISISAAGFAKQIRETVAIPVNVVRRVDVALTVAKVNETLTVTAEAPLLQTDKADVHTDLSISSVRAQDYRRRPTLPPAIRSAPSASVPADSRFRQTAPVLTVQPISIHGFLRTSRMFRQPMQFKP